MAQHKACPICHSDNDQAFYSYHSYGVDVTVVICTVCGLVRNNPLHSEEELVSARGGSIKELHHPAYNRSIAVNRAKRYFRGIRRYVKEGDSLLDVGCAEGTLLNIASQRGLQCTGIDIDPTAKEVQHPASVQIITGTVDSLNPSTNQYDVITASHVLEHVHDPEEFLKSIRGLLKPGGVLQIEVPNILRPKTSYQRNFCIQHLFYFCPETLTALLSRNGFQPLSITCFARDSFQVVATPGECVHEELFRGADWHHVLSTIQRYRWTYKLTGQFLWRKIPLLNTRMYRVAYYKDLTEFAEHPALISS